MIGTLDLIAPDPLLKLIGEFRNDKNEDKIDLGVGVYRNARGLTPVMEAVKLAERELLASQDSKAYIGLAGDGEFLDLMGQLVFGDISPKKTRFAYLQTPGGSAALRLASDLIKRSTPDAAIWVGLPCWANHLPIFKAAGLNIKTYQYYDSQSRAVDESSMLESFASANDGDLILLQGCCHNPTGVDLTLEQWKAVTKLVQAKGLIPLIDIAYQGLGKGLKEDLYGVNHIMEAVPEALVAVSCSKNFGLYRERTGGLFVMADSVKRANIGITNLYDLARSSYSMPPDHGAAIVKTILKDNVLKSSWEHELADMRQRISSTRKSIIEAFSDNSLSYMASDNGMFSLLSLNSEQIDRLRVEHSIYMAGNGRINIAGLKPHSLDKLVSSIKAVL